jgi:NADH-quinone oxidoreductase subunit L
VPMLGVSIAVAGTGIGVGWWVYGRRAVVINTRVWKHRFGYLYGMLVQKFYFDLTYDRLFVQGYFKAADGMTAFDQNGVDAVVNGAGRGWVLASKGAWRFDGTVIDGVVNGLASLAKAIGRGARRIQTGRLQSYQRLVVGAVVLLMLILVVVTRGA